MKSVITPTSFAFAFPFSVTSVFGDSSRWKSRIHYEVSAINQIKSSLY